MSSHSGVKGCVAVALIGLATANVVQAESIAIEQFDYAAGASLNKANGGAGWDGPWFQSPLVRTDNRTVGKSMTFLNLHVSGRRMEQVGGGRSFRKLDLHRAAVAPLVARGDHGLALGKAGTTIWIGFLIAMPSSPRKAYGGIHLCDGLGDLREDAYGNKKAHQRVSLGRNNTSEGWYLGRVTNGGPGAGKWDSKVVANDKTRFLVYRFDFHKEDVEGWLFIDPLPEKEPSTKSAVIHASGITRFKFNTLSVGCGSGAVFHLDELRIASSFKEVAPAQRE